MRAGTNPKPNRIFPFILAFCCSFLIVACFVPSCQAAKPERLGPYSGGGDADPGDPKWNQLLRSVWNSRNNQVNYDTEKKDPKAERDDTPPDESVSLVTKLWKVIVDLVGKLVGILWDMAQDFLRPIVQALLEHLLTLLHNPNVASTLDNRSMPLEGLKAGAAKVPYDLVDPTTKKSVRQGFEFSRAIAINLLLVLFLVAIWKYWTEAAWRNGHNLMGAVGRLIATTGLILGWPILSFYLVEISNEMIDYMFKSIDYSALDMSVMRIVGLGFKGGVAALFTSVASGVIGGLVGGPGGIFIAGFGGALGGLIYFLFLGITIYETVYLIVLKAVQTILMLAQFMFAPIFLMFFALPDTERIASTFIKSCIEVSLWTFFWAGMLRLLVIIIQPGNSTVWGQGIMLLGLLQLMIQVPAFMAQAQISPISEFLSPRGAMNGVGSLFAGAGQLARAATEFHRRRQPDNTHSQKEPVKAPSFDRGNDGTSGVRGGDGSGPPPKFGNPTGSPSDKTPSDISRMNAKELTGLMQRHALNDQQTKAARARLAELMRSGDLGAAALSPQEFAALAPLMNDGEFNQALESGRLSGSITPAHLAALANTNLSNAKRAVLKSLINRCSPGELAALTPKQLGAIAPLLEATDGLATALASDPDGANKLGALLPGLNAASFDRLVTNDALKGKLEQLTPRQLAQLNGGQLAKVGNQLSDSKLMDQSLLSALTPDQLKGMESVFDRLSPDQKKTLTSRLNGAQAGALARILAPVFSDAELADLPVDKLAGLAGALSEDQLRGLGSHTKFDGAKLAAVAPQVKDPNRLQALAQGLAANPKAKDFPADTLAKMYGGLNGDQIGALTPALSFDSAKVKAVAPALKSAEQVARFAAAIEDDTELSNALVTELSAEQCKSLPRACVGRLTHKELDALSPKKLAAIGPMLTPGQTASISDQKLASVATALSANDRRALVENMPTLSAAQRGILAPAEPVSAGRDKNPISLREAIDHLAEGVDDGYVFVGRYADSGYHASFDRSGRLVIRVPLAASPQAEAEYKAEVALAQMTLYNPGARAACARAYEASRGITDPSVYTSDPAGQARVAHAMWNIAMNDSRSYLNGEAGGGYTNFLRNNSTPLTPEIHGGEVARMVDTTAPDHPFSKTYLRAKDLCKIGGIEPNTANIAKVLTLRSAGFTEQAVQNANLQSEVSEYMSQPGSDLAYAAQASRFLAPSDLTVNRIRTVQRFLQDGNSANRLRTVFDVDLLEQVYSSGGTVSSETLGKAGTISEVYRSAQELQRNHYPSYANPGTPSGAPGPRSVAGQATYRFMLTQVPTFEPGYGQFGSPSTVPTMSATRLQEVLPIYLRAGLSHEQLAMPDVAFSIQAIDAYNPELHTKLAKGIQLVGAAPGVSPGLALVVDQAERYGHTKLNKEILIATEYNMRQRERSTGATVQPSTREEIMQYLEDPASSRIPLKTY